MRAGLRRARWWLFEPLPCSCYDPVTGCLHVSVGPKRVLKAKLFATPRVLAMGLLGWWPLSICFPKQAPAQSRPPPGAPGDEKRHSAAVSVAAAVPPAAPSPITRQPAELASHPLPDLPGSVLPTPESSFTSVAAAPLDAAGAGAGAAAVALGKAELIPGIGWSAMSAPSRPLLDSANQADGAAGAGPVN